MKKIFLYFAFIFCMNHSGHASITITPATLPKGYTGHTYSQQFSATGGSGRYTWIRKAGTLPPGTSLNVGSGLLSGVLTTTTSTVYTFTIQVTDASAATATHGYTVTVAPNILNTQQLCNLWYRSVPDFAGITDTWYSLWNILTNDTPVTNIVAGTGISISGDTITNTSPGGMQNLHQTLVNGNSAGGLGIDSCLFIEGAAGHTSIDLVHGIFAEGTHSKISFTDNNLRNGFWAYDSAYTLTTPLALTYKGYVDSVNNLAFARPPIYSFIREGQPTRWTQNANGENGYAWACDLADNNWLVTGSPTNVYSWSPLGVVTTYTFAPTVGTFGIALCGNNMFVTSEFNYETVATGTGAVSQYTFAVGDGGAEFSPIFDGQNVRFFTTNSIQNKNYMVVVDGGLYNGSSIGTVLHTYSVSAALATPESGVFLNNKEYVLNTYSRNGGSLDIGSITVWDSLGTASTHTFSCPGIGNTDGGMQNSLQTDGEQLIVFGGGQNSGLTPNVLFFDENINLQNSLYITGQADQSNNGAFDGTHYWWYGQSGELIEFNYSGKQLTYFFGGSGAAIGGIFYGCDGRIHISNTNADNYDILTIGKY